MDHLVYVVNELKNNKLKCTYYEESTSWNHSTLGYPFIG